MKHVALALVVALALPLSPDPARAQPPERCRAFLIDDAGPARAETRLVRLCARLVELHARGALDGEESVAAVRLGRYLAALGRLEMRAVRVDGELRLRRVRRASETSRFLIADHLGLLALADRLAPAV